MAYCRVTTTNFDPYTAYTAPEQCYKSGDEEGIPGGDSGDGSNLSEPQSSEELLDSEDVELDDDDLSFWPLPSVNKSSCRFKHVHKNSN